MQDLLQEKFGLSIQRLIGCADSQHEAIIHASQCLNDTLLGQHTIYCADQTPLNLGEYMCKLLSVEFEHPRPSLPAIHLSRLRSHDTAHTTQHRLAALGKPNDTLILFTENHESNDEQLIELASQFKIKTIHIGPSKIENADENILLDGTPAQRMEQAVLITHQLCALVEHQLFGTR